MKNTKTVFKPIPYRGLDNKIYNIIVYKGEVVATDLNNYLSEKPLFKIKTQELSLNVPHIVLMKDKYHSGWEPISQRLPPFHTHEAPPNWLYMQSLIPGQLFPNYPSVETLIVTQAFSEKNIMKTYPPITINNINIGIWYGIPRFNINFSHTPIEICQKEDRQYIIVTYRNRSYIEDNATRILDITNRPTVSSEVYFRKKL